jgi:hypothetical protein
VIDLVSSPRVAIGRRALLKLPALALAAVATEDRALASALAQSSKTLDYPEFLAAAVPLARAMVGDHSPAGQDAYLYGLAALAVRLRDVPVPEMEAQANPGHALGANPGGDPFVVLHWRLEPGAVIGYHPHRYGHVCTVGLAGEAWIGNFELLDAGDYGKTEHFQVRRTRRELLAPGRINTISLARDYIHGFQAGPQGARGLDITTRIKERLPTARLEVNEADPVDAEAGLYEARWGT